MLIQNEFGLAYDTNFGLLCYKEREMLIPISALKTFCSLENSDLTLRLKVYNYENSEDGLARQVSGTLISNFEAYAFFFLATIEC